MTLAVETTVLSLALVIFGYMVLPWLPLVVTTALLLAVFAIGFGLALAAANVYLRDMTYLWSIVVQAWFFSTPIIYSPELVERELADHPMVLRIYNDLPMAVVVRIFRDLMFDLRMPRLIDYGLLTGYALIAVLLGWWLFDRLEGRFAEEL